MKKRTILSLMLLTVAFLPIFAQKVKVKKNVVYVDDVAMYKSYRTSGGALSFDQVRVVTTMNDDTIVWAKPAEVRLSKTVYEDGFYVENYWVLSFAGTDFTMNFNTHIGNLDEDLIKAGVLKDGKVDSTALPAFDQSMIRYTQVIDNLQKAKENRQKLAQRPDYNNYIGQLTKRHTYNKLQIASNNAILFQSNTGEKPEQIGFLKKEVGTVSTSFHIHRQKDKTFVGSISYTPETGKVFIRSWLDNVGVEYFITNFFDDVELLKGVKYLVDFGYL